MVTIKLTYEMACGPVLQNFAVKQQDIRAVLASLNFLDSLDIIKVMNTGVWKRWHTFDHFYFRDMVSGPDSM